MFSYFLPCPFSFSPSFSFFLSRSIFINSSSRPCRIYPLPSLLTNSSLFSYRQAPVQFIIGGFLPFSAIYIELHYIYAAIWGHTSYGLYGVLFLVFIILLLVCACITVALTYFQLSVEDHNWWWRSFISAGSTGFFVFGYSIYYYYQLSGMSGFLQVVKYFSFVTISCYYFFVLLGTVGFISSFLFVKHIYSTLKID